MNIFRLIGDFLHVFAMIFLPATIIKKKSYVGVSQKTQLLLLMVFVTRYLDLFYSFISVYNSFFKAIFIILTATTFLMGYCYKNVEKHDSFNSELLVFLVMFVAILNTSSTGNIEIFWSFSEYLEAFAIIPQVYMVLKLKKITKEMIVYMICTTLYKTFYIMNWIYRSEMEGFSDDTAETSGKIFILVYGFSSLMILWSGIKHSKENNEMLKKNLFSGMIVPVTIFSITSNEKAGLDNAPLVNQDFSQKEKQHIETV